MNLVQFASASLIVATIYYLVFYWGSINKKYIVVAIFTFFILAENDKYMTKQLKIFAKRINFELVKLIAKIFFVGYSLYAFFYL